MPVDPFVVHVATLRRVVGTRWHEVRRGPIDPDRVLVAASPADSTVPEGAEAECDVVLQSFDGGVMVTGTVRAPWPGTCRRCTAPVAGSWPSRCASATASRAPATADPDDEEAYPIVDDSLTWAPWSATPWPSSCPSPPSAARPAGACAPSAGRTATRSRAAAWSPRDPRWANLDVLRSTS